MLVIYYSMDGERFFRRVIANSVIALVVFGIMALAIAPRALEAASRSNVGATRQGNNTLSAVAIIFGLNHSAEYINEALDILDRHNAVGTFFVDGRWVERNESMLVQIADKGHTIGNYGFFGRNMTLLTSQGQRDELLATSNIVERILDEPTTILLPPHGQADRNLVAVAASIGMHTIIATHTTADFRAGDLRISRLRAGNFILMHMDSNMPQLLDEILTNLASRGLGTLTVSELL